MRLVEHVPPLPRGRRRRRRPGAQPHGGRRRLDGRCRRSATGGVARCTPSAQQPWPRSDRASDRSRALTAFHRAASVRSPHGRAMAFATLGAADVLSRRPRRSRPLVRCCSTGSSSIAVPSDDPLAVAGAAPPLRQRGASRGAAGRRVRDRTTRASSARGLAMLRFLAGCRDTPRPPVRDGNRRARPRAEVGPVRPAADRGRCHRRRVRARLRHHRRPFVARRRRVGVGMVHGRQRRRHPHVRSASPARDSTDWKRTGATRTAERNRRSPRSSTYQQARRLGVLERVAS